MKLNLLFVAIMAFAPCMAGATLPHIGLYQTIDDNTNQPKSIVALYEYADDDEMELAGRIVALYNADGTISETIAAPVKTATKVKGAPKYAGLDIIWDMEWSAKGNKFEDGKIMDPQSGKVYSSVIWQDAPGKLNVRGKIGPFGRTQVWHALDTADLPMELQNLDTGDWKPLIRK